MADMQTQMWEALQALPRPVDDAAVMDKANEVLGPQGLAQQFSQWWKQNGPYVLRRLNGG